MSMIARLKAVVLPWLDHLLQRSSTYRMVIEEGEASRERRSARYPVRDRITGDWWREGEPHV